MNDLIERMEIRFGGASTFTIAMLSMAMGFGLAFLPLGVLVTLGVVIMAVVGAFTALMVAPLIVGEFVLTLGRDAVKGGKNLSTTAKAVVENTVHIQVATAAWMLHNLSRVKSPAFDVLAFAMARLAWRVENATNAFSQAGVKLVREKHHTCQAIAWWAKDNIASALFGARWVFDAYRAST